MNTYYRLTKDITSPSDYAELGDITIAAAGEPVRFIEQDENGIMVETLDHRASFYLEEGDGVEMKGDILVSVEARPNVDFAQTSRNGSIKAVKHWLPVASLRQASEVCRSYIDALELGGGNWTGGDVKKGRKIVAYVSYNGRVWAGKGMKAEEIKI